MTFTLRNYFRNNNSTVLQQMDLTNILAVSGKPDLNELVSRTKNGAIVKNLVSGQKFPVFASSSISQLSEIRMFTTNDEKPLEEIFEII